MLTAFDVAASQNSSLSPSAREALNVMSASRAAIVATAQFADYPASADSVILTQTFPAGAFVAGNQVRIFAYGTFFNAAGVTDSFSPSVYVTQGSSIQAVGVLYANFTATGRWVIDGVVSFSVPGPAQMGPSDKRVSPQAQSGVLVVGSMVRYNATKAGTFNQDIGVTSDPNTLQVDNSQPVGIALSVNTGANTTFKVMGGWMEAL